MLEYIHDNDEDARYVWRADDAGGFVCMAGNQRDLRFEVMDAVCCILRIDPIQAQALWQKFCEDEHRLVDEFISDRTRIGATHDRRVSRHD